MPYTVTDIATLAALVPHCPVYGNSITPTIILEALGSIDPTPTTITWLREALTSMSHPNHIYREWPSPGTGDINKIPNIQQSNPTQHWLMAYPKYLPQWVILDQNMTAKVTPNSSVTLHQFFPDWINHSPPDGQYFSDWWKWNPDYAILLNKQIGYMDNTEVEIRRVRYLTGYKASTTTITTLIPVLEELKSKLTPYQYKYVPRSVGRGKIRKWWLRNDGMDDLMIKYCRLIRDDREADLIERFGTRVRLLFCPEPFKKHLLGLTWTVEDTYLNRAIIEIIEDPQTYQTSIIQRNRDYINMMIKYTNPKECWYDDDRRNILSYSPCDIITYIVDNQIHCVTRDESNWNMSDSLRRDIKAVNDKVDHRLPTPRNILSLIDWMCDKNTYKKREHEYYQ